MEFTVFLFVVSVLWGCLNSYLAQYRGRNLYVWFLLGFLFGPFPLIFLYLLPAAGKVKEEDIEDIKEETPAETDNPDAADDAGINIAHHAPFDQQDWYYLDEQRTQHGPHTFSEMRKFTRKEIISGQTYVWNQSMSNWKKVKDIPEFERALNF
jgi:hypothetical protein